MVRRVRGPASAIVPYIILLVGLGVTAAAAWNTAATARLEDRLRFESAADAVRSEIGSRTDAYVAMLLGGAGLFAASADVDFLEFRAYVARLSLSSRYPGIQGIGFTRRITAGERQAVLERVRAHVGAFDFWPASPGADEFHAILYLEPHDPRNQRALGYDMWSEPVRRSAMQRARDSGEPTATRRVRLVQEDIEPRTEQAGFLIYVPVYRGGEVPAGLDARRERLLGFVYSPFRADDLLRGVLGAALEALPRLEVYDGDPREQQLLHRSADGPPADMVMRRTMEVAGRTWTLVFHFDRTSSAAGATLTWMVAVGGVVLTILLFAITQAQIQARDAAERIADDLRRSEELLRRANAAKDNFLATVSHELRTPINAIVGWTHMLRQGKVSPDRVPHALNVIARNAAAQTRLVEDLLDVCQAADQRLRLEVTNVDVGSMIGAAIESIKPAADAAGVRIVRQGVRDGLGVVKGDAARLQQILGNLLANAVKFSAEGGVVTVAADVEEGQAVLSVSDTGVGIPLDFLPHVFERFRQGDSSTTRAHPGVGIGLTIAKHLVELHGGAISASSEGVGKGATFVVRLPLAEEGTAVA